MAIPSTMLVERLLAGEEVRIRNERRADDFEGALDLLHPEVRETVQCERGRGGHHYRLRPFLCGGCNVREPWEHRCHGAGCSCSECNGRTCSCADCTTDWLLGRTQEG